MSSIRLDNTNEYCFSVDNVIYYEYLEESKQRNRNTEFYIDLSEEYHNRNDIIIRVNFYYRSEKIQNPNYKEIEGQKQDYTKSWFYLVDNSVSILSPSLAKFKVSFRTPPGYNKKNTSGYCRIQIFQNEILLETIRTNLIKIGTKFAAKKAEHRGIKSAVYAEENKAEENYNGDNVNNDDDVAFNNDLGDMLAEDSVVDSAAAAVVVVEAALIPTDTTASTGNKRGAASSASVTTADRVVYCSNGSSSSDGNFFIPRKGNRVDETTHDMPSQFSKMSVGVSESLFDGNVGLESVAPAVAEAVTGMNGSDVYGIVSPALTSSSVVDGGICLSEIDPVTSSSISSTSELPAVTVPKRQVTAHGDDNEDDSISLFSHSAINNNNNAKQNAKKSVTTHSSAATELAIHVNNIKQLHAKYCINKNADRTDASAQHIEKCISAYLNSLNGTNKPAPDVARLIVDLYVFCSEFYEHQGNYIQAHSMMDKSGEILNQYDVCNTSLDRKGMIYLNEKKYKEAHSFFQKAVNEYMKRLMREPTNATLKFSLAGSYMCLGNCCEQMNSTSDIKQDEHINEAIKSYKQSSNLLGSLPTSEEVNTILLNVTGAVNRLEEYKKVMALIG